MEGAKVKVQVELFTISFRLNFDSVSDSEFEESEDHVSAIEFYDNDPDLPIISSMDHGYPVHLIIEELLSNVNETRACKVQPLCVMKNAVF